MSVDSIRHNWKWLLAPLSLIVIRSLLKRRKYISLRGKVVLITGGSRGLGLAMAEEFAHQGAKLIICSRSQEELLQAGVNLTKDGAEVLTLLCDVTDQTQVQQMIIQANEQFGRIDILVNNAGIITVGPLRAQTREDFEESMNIMFWGTYTTTMAVLPQMLERHEGRIVNIASVGGKVSVPHMLSYSSAKFAVIGFSEGLHAELAKEGIIVTTVAPGLMRTGSTVNAITKGEKYRTEYTLFTLLDTLPLFSISAHRAARQIVNATKHGDTELIITMQAQCIARLYGAFPALFTDLLALVDRLLPRSNGIDTTRYAGHESETAITRSPLTILGQKAAVRYNEQT